jgi:mRNA interferase RelE/StbE
VWILELTERSKRQLSRIDKPDRDRILSYVHDRLLKLDDPRSLGIALKGSELGSYWRFRVGDYRLICNLQNDLLVILLVEVGHRSDVYRRKD